MSDNWIILIPEHAGYLPPAEKQQQALNTFRGFTPGADEVVIELSDEIRFVDCGGNFERVFCPACGNELNMKWWKEQMDKDYDDGFSLAPIKMPCCSAFRNLHELRYDWQQGFARFSLEAMNPNVGELPKDEVNTLQAILDCPLRPIYCHI